jgi:hypothetical protein
LFAGFEVTGVLICGFSAITSVGFAVSAIFSIVLVLSLLFATSIIE